MRQMSKGQAQTYGAPNGKRNLVQLTARWMKKNNVGPEFLDNLPPRKDGQLAFDQYEPIGASRGAKALRAGYDKHDNMVKGRNQFTVARVRRYKPTKAQAEHLAQKPEPIDQSWRERQALVFVLDEIETLITCLMAWHIQAELMARRTSETVSRDERPTQVESDNRPHRKNWTDFYAKRPNHPVLSYVPQPSPIFWDEHRVQTIVQTKETIKWPIPKAQTPDWMTDKAPRRDIVEMYNELGAWLDNFNDAKQDLARGESGALSRFIKASELPLPVQMLRQLAQGHKLLAHVVNEILGAWEFWDGLLKRPEPAPGANYVSHPELHKAPGARVTMYDVTDETIAVRGRVEESFFIDNRERARYAGQKNVTDHERIHGHRLSSAQNKIGPSYKGAYAKVRRKLKWTAPEGSGWTKTDADAARLGGWYAARPILRTKLRMTKSGRKLMRLLGWHWPSKVVVPFAKGNGSVRINYFPKGAPKNTLGFDSTGDVIFRQGKKWRPLALKFDWARRLGRNNKTFKFVGWTSEFVVRSHGAASGGNFVGFGGQRKDASPYVQKYRTDKLRFAKRDLRVRDKGENNRYQAISVEQRQRQAEDRLVRRIAWCLQVIKQAYGMKKAQQMARQLSPQEIIVLGANIKEALRN